MEENRENRRRVESRDDSESGASESADLSRRQFLGGTSAALVAVSALPQKVGAEELARARVVEEQVAAVPRTTIGVVVNGTEHEIEVEDRWTLNEMLRDGLGLMGSKLGCNRGECGACTVMVDGEAVYSCSTLAVWMDGRTVVTVEGLERDGELSPLQRAFLEYNGAQCGFCTPGQIMAATALLGSNPRPTAEEIREGLAGNLCRCSNYNAIVEAVQAAAGTLESGGA